MMRVRILLTIIGYLFFTSVFSQEKTTTYQSEIFGSFSTGDNTPFWMLYHNWGMVPLNANNFYIRGDVDHSQRINKDWSFKLGTGIAASSPHSYGTVWVQELYGELDWKFFRLNIGSKEDYTSILDQNLSSGDFDLSNNARPHPEVKLSFPDFVLIPKTKGRLYVKGDFAVGKFMDGDWQEETARPYNQQYTKDVLSHHKSVYFRLGNIENKDKFQIIAGLDHHAQWGGSIFYFEGMTQDYTEQKQPKGLDDFFRVVVAKEGSSNASVSDRAFVSGSQVGSYHLRFDYKLKNADKLSVYTQHFFEDGSGMAFKNYRDMLLGFQYKSAKRQLLSNALFEYVYTKNQSGPIHFNLELDDEHKHLHSKGTGNDDYYNNADYKQGRSYYGRTLGTALFLSPEFNESGRLYFESNRIISLHMGLEGYFCSNLGYRLLATTGQTWGRYYVPFIEVRDGFASNLDLMYNCSRIQGLDLKVSLGYNTGDFFGDSAFGGGITITKRGIIK